MRVIFLYLMIFSPLFIASEQIFSYTDIIKTHCSPPFHYYKSWCYYVFPNLTLDWSGAYRLCHSIDKHTHLAYISGDDEMVDPLRDILVNREKFQDIRSIWTNTTWGQQRRTTISRHSKRSCRKIELKSNLKSGHIDMLRMPFANCREKHAVMCRKELPTNIICRRPWALAYGICYYLDEQSRTTQTEEEERNTLQCQAWNGQLFSSSKQERTILLPFLSYSLYHLRASLILPENIGGVSYSFANIVQENCSLISGDVYLSAAVTQLQSSNHTKNCSSYNSYTLCRQSQNISCEPPWFYDDGFCLYYSRELLVDMSTASIECSQNGGHLLYINNKEELFRLTNYLIPLTPFFKHRSMAGVWLGLTYKALGSANGDFESSFDWQWDLSIRSYLDQSWQLSEWRTFFQHRLSPYIVSAGDCAALILDSKIREPIERTSCYHQRPVVCRKPLGNERKSFHRRAEYERFLRLQNQTDPPESIRKPSNVSSLEVSRSVLEPLNSTTYRLILYLNGSSTFPTNFVYLCQSKGILFQRLIPAEDLSSLLKFDLATSSRISEYQLLFNHLSSVNCTNSCIYLTCLENDPWYYSLPQMQARLDILRNQTSTNNRCLSRYNQSNFHAQICSLLIEQFRVSEGPLAISPLSTTNECRDFGGQCIPDTLITSTSMQFTDNTLNCPVGFICWFQGERCSNDSYCMDRIRFPCPSRSHLSNVRCSNSHHDCCTSSLPISPRPLLISSVSKQQTWNILLPIYYFSFHGTSKWDKFFFNAWLRTDADMSHDFVNDEFLFTCTAIFLEATLLLTHESCLPTRLTSNDKRSILFALIKKDEQDEYEKVALHIDTYQISSPFQLVRLAFEQDILVNKSSKKLNDMKLQQEKRNELYCVLVLSEHDVRQVRLVDDFERQFILDETSSLFSLGNSEDDNDDDELWSFAPVVCVLNDQSKDWTIVGISGKQLKHKCTTVQQTKFCQMTFIYSSTWSFE